MESLRWLAVNAGQISIAGIFATLLVVGALSLQRKWVVPGWMYQECIADRDKFESKVEAIAKSNEDKIAQLQMEVAAMRDQRRAR